MNFSEHSEEKEDEIFPLYIKYEPRPIYSNQTPIFFQFRRKVGIKESHTFSQLKGCLRRVGQKFYKEELELKKEERGIKEVTEPKEDDIFKLFDIVAHKVKSRHVTNETFAAWLDGLTKEKTGFNLLLVKQKELSFSQEKDGNKDETQEQGTAKTQNYNNIMEEEDNEFHFHTSNIYFPENLSDMLPEIQASDLQVEDDPFNVNFEASLIIRIDPNTGSTVEEDRALFEEFFPS